MPSVSQTNGWHSRETETTCKQWRARTGTRWH